MAQRIFGIDLGSYLVKVAVFELGFRSAELKTMVSVGVRDFLEAPEPASDPVALKGEAPEPASDPMAPEGEAPEGERLIERPDVTLRPRTQAVLAALGQAMRQVGAPPDRLILGLPGDLAAFRVLEFPFSDPKKVGAVLAYELEGQIPFEIDEVVHDHLLTRGPDGLGRALVGLVPVDRVAPLLDRLGQIRVDPDVLTLAPFGYQTLAPEAGPAAVPVVVVDVGHERTNLVVLRPGGDPLLARTISRGGAHITREIALRYQVSEERAEQIKHTYGQLPVLGGPAVAGDRVPVVEATRAAVAPLVRSLRQTLLPLQSRSELAPQQVLLCGGTSALPGLTEYLAESLGLPVTTDLPLGCPTGPGARGLVLAAGLARAGAERQGTGLNLRKGPLARKEQVSLLKRRALYFTWTAVVLLGLLVLGGFLRLSLLRAEEAQLRRRLAHATLQIFDRPMNDPDAVEHKISRALRSRKVTSLPIPDASAYALLSEISRRVPPRDKSKLDVTRLYIRPGKVDMTATAKDAKEVETVVEALKKIPCVKKVKQGRVTEVTVREMIDEKVETDKRRQFKVDITHECI